MGHDTDASKAIFSSKGNNKPRLRFSVTRDGRSRLDKTIGTDFWGKSTKGYDAARPTIEARTHKVRAGKDNSKSLKLPCVIETVYARSVR